MLLVGGLPAALMVCALVACGGGGSSAGSATGPQTTSSDSRASTGAGNAGPTTITVAGGLDGALPGDGAACIPIGSASFQVGITGTIGGTRYVLKFDAPAGTTDLASASTVALHLVPSTGSTVTTALDINGAYTCAAGSST